MAAISEIVLITFQGHQDHPKAPYLKRLIKLYTARQMVPIEIGLVVPDLYKWKMITYDFEQLKATLWLWELLMIGTLSQKRWLMLQLSMDLKGRLTSFGELFSLISEGSSIITNLAHKRQTSKKRKNGKCEQWKRGSHRPSERGLFPLSASTSTSTMTAYWQHGYLLGCAQTAKSAHVHT